MQQENKSPCSVSRKYKQQLLKATILIQKLSRI